MNSIRDEAKKTAPNLRFKGGFFVAPLYYYPPQKIKIEEKMSKQVKIKKDKNPLQVAF